MSDAGFMAAVKARLPMVLLVWTLVNGIANVATQFSLIIPSLQYPPEGSYKLYQWDNGGFGLPVAVIYVDPSGANQVLGNVTLPVLVPNGGEMYVNIPGSGPFEGGMIVVRNGDGTITDGFYRPYAVITAQSVVYDCPHQNQMVTGPTRVECFPKNSGVSYALIALGFGREALVLGILGFVIYQKKALSQKIEVLAKSSAVGVIWFNCALTQAEFRKALKEKSLSPLPLLFRVNNGLLELAGTIVGLTIAIQSVQVFSTTKRPVPATFVSMLVFGGVGLFMNVVAGCIFLWEKWKQRKGEANPAIPMSTP